MSGLGYPSQGIQYMLGTPTTPVTLTAAYADNVSPEVNITHVPQATIYFAYTPGAGGGGNSVQIRIQGRPDDPNSTKLYQETFANVTGATDLHVLGEHSFVGALAGTTYRGYFYAPPAFNILTLAAKETVAAGAAGTLTLKVGLSGSVS